MDAPQALLIIWAGIVPALIIAALLVNVVVNNIDNTRALLKQRGPRHGGRGR